MATEYRLPFTAKEIEEKLNKITDNTYCTEIEVDEKLKNKQDKNFIVHITSTTTDGTTTYSADKTFEEIAEAYNKGANLYLTGISAVAYMPLYKSYYPSNFRFAYYEGMSMQYYQIVINSNNTVNYTSGIRYASKGMYGGVRAEGVTETDTVEAKIGADGKLYVPAYPITDTEISAESENPVQNKVIKEYVDNNIISAKIPIQDAVERNQVLTVEEIDENGKITKLSGRYPAVFRRVYESQDYLVETPVSGVQKFGDLPDARLDLWDRKNQLNIKYGKFLEFKIERASGNKYLTLTTTPTEGTLIEIDEKNYYVKSANFVRAYIINDISTLTEEYKEKFSERGIYYEFINESVISQCRNMRITMYYYVKLDDKFLSNNILDKISPPTTAEVGQMLIVKEVDESGKPTKWECVDRTHYSEGGGEVVEIVNETVEYTGDGYIVTTPFELVVGDTYKVSYNDTECECVCWTYTNDGVTGLILGNGEMFTGNNTGEPFCIIQLVDMGVTLFAPFNTEGTEPIHLVISGVPKEVVHKLDNKYLDLEWIPSYKEVLLAEEITFISVDFDNGVIVGNLGDYLQKGSFYKDQKLAVYFDGEKYDTAYRTIGEGIDELAYIGNGVIGNTVLPNTGEPFCIVSNGGVTHVICSEGSHTISVYELVPNPMPEEFLPEHIHDWSDLKEKYEEVLQNQTVACELSVTNGFVGVLTSVIPLTLGKKMKIIFSGVEYIDVVHLNDNGQYLYVGNGCFGEIGGADTGEPFCFATSNFGDGDDVSGLYATTNGNHTIALYENVVNKLPEEFLPESVATKEYVEEHSGGGTFIVNITGDDENGYTADKTYTEIKEAHESGKVVQAFFCFTMFPLVLYDDYEYAFRSDAEGYCAWIYIYDEDKVEVEEYNYLEESFYDMFNSTSNYSNIDNLNTANKTLVGAINESTWKLAGSIPIGATGLNEITIPNKFRELRIVGGVKNESSSLIGITIKINSTIISNKPTARTPWGMTSFHLEVFSDVAYAESYVNKDGNPTMETDTADIRNVITEKNNIVGVELPDKVSVYNKKIDVWYR